MRQGDREKEEESGGMMVGKGNRTSREDWREEGSEGCRKKKNEMGSTEPEKLRTLPTAPDKASSAKNI